MSYPLRLPPELNAEARKRCERLGISLNAFIAVALDAYLRGSPAEPAGEPARRPPAKAVRPRPVEPGSSVKDPAAWREWHEPDMWPYVDPEFAGRFEAVDVDDDAGAVALELEYWSTRQRPA